jgi:two-component SAPR family response regulator
MDILIVDDDETLRQSLVMLLKSEGHEVTEAADGEKALEQAKRHYFDLVLCDVRMPGIDGIETISRLRASIDDAHFVVMTGYASEDAPIKALRLGVDDYLTKPFDIPIFLEKLRAMARRRQKTRSDVELSLWKLVATLKEQMPPAVRRSQPIEEKVATWGKELDLSDEQIQLMRLAAWLYPLAEGLSAPQEDSEWEPSSPAEELVNLLRHASLGLGPDRTADVLRAAMLSTQGKGDVSNLHPEVARLIDGDLSVQEPESDALKEQYDLEVRTLGGLRLKVKGETLDRKSWQSANARWLFVYLLSRGGQSVPEDRLAKIFWPGSPGKKAHRALVSSVHRARKALGDADLLVRYDRSYGVARDCNYWLDSEILTGAYQSGTRHYYQKNMDQALAEFDRVLSLYRGPYLPDCHDEWAVKVREGLKLKAVDAAEKGAEILLESNPARSEEWCRKAVSWEPTSEPGWATLIKSLAAQSRRKEVEKAYNECAKVLLEELGLKPGAAVQDVYDEALEG